MTVHYFEYNVSSGLKNKKKLSSFLTKTAIQYLPKIKKINLNYIFCTDDYLLEKNIQFLNHNTLTDILTFDLSENEQDLTSEIYISIERVRENAKKFTVTNQEELHRVIFHGLLHLCGFKDKTLKEQKEMRYLEQECIHQYLYLKS